MRRRIILYELNEVPFRVLDWYCRRHPGSAFARILPDCAQYETRTEDQGHLSPWITWPSLHRGVSGAEHGIQELGQDTAEVDRRCPPLWMLVARQGLKAGVCGSLHSYPLPRDLSGYSFFIPDVFAWGPECFPRDLSAFQEFNLRMSRNSPREVESGVAWPEAARLLAKLGDIGLTPRTLWRVGLQLAQERVFDWRKVRRRTYQAVLSFDVFLAQLRRSEPSLVTFFTNHVASAMHRYWAATFPSDYTRFGFESDWVRRYAHEIDFAMRAADEFLATLVEFVERHPEFMIWVASSMGQAATQTRTVSSILCLRDARRFLRVLGADAGEWTERPAMFPQVNLEGPPAAATRLREALAGVRIGGQPLGFQCDSARGFVSVDFGHGDLSGEGGAVKVAGRAVTLEEAGLRLMRVADGVEANAYHVPEGMLLVFDPRSRGKGDGRRRTVSVLEVAPAILERLGLCPPAYMRRPTFVAG
jgi:hypothetical protein